VNWIDVDELREYVASHLAKGPTEPLKPHWDVILPAALDAAYGTIWGAFAAKGFTQSQVDQWDRGAEFQRDIAAWFALKRLAVIHPDVVGQQHLTELDRRPELFGTNEMPAVVLTVDGQAVYPEGTYGLVTTGPMRTADDLFLMDPDDTRIGQTTRW
jgi:hypothetical protein